MVINDVAFSADLEEILNELVSQMRMNNIYYISKMIPTSKDVQICCPFHNGGQERRPSAGIRRSDGLFHCFACGEVHTLPEVISHCFGKDEFGTFGWSWLIKNFMTVSVQDRKDLNLDLSRSLGQKEIEYVSEEELDSYRYIHPYMYKRKLTDEIIELFDIGYDKNTDCITFPNRDINGNTLFIARRSVQTKFFSYPEGVEKPVYGLYELNKSGKKPNELIICESMLDALYFWTIGKCAIALNGLGTLSQFDQLNRFPCRKFILCTDNDGAGMKARKRIRANLKNKIITEYVLPQGKKDANDCTIDELKSLQEVF